MLPLDGLLPDRRPPLPYVEIWTCDRVLWQMEQLKIKFKASGLFLGLCSFVMVDVPCCHILLGRIIKARV